MIFLNILEFLLSKKILVVLSGLIFTGVAVASSGAESLFQENGLIVNETKIPEVQKIAETQSSPSPTPIQSGPAHVQQASKKSSQTPSPKPTAKPTPASPLAVSATPKPTVTPKPSAAGTGSSQATITGLRQTGSDDIEDEEDESDKSEINEAFQKANEQSEKED